MPTAHASSATVSALDWYATMSAPVSAWHDGVRRLSVRRYHDTDPEMIQPALSDNLLCMHLGGAKTVQRWHEGRMTVHDVDLRALTILPAGQVNRWLTTGPVDFAHITLSQALLAQLAAEEFDQEPAGCELVDMVGGHDAYLQQLFGDLLAAVEHRETAARLYPESLLVVVATSLLARHGRRAGGGEFRASALASKGGLAAWRLRRVIDYMQANLAGDIALGDLVAVTGLSRAQFFRAFHQSTGLSPHRYLLRLRLEHARALLEDTALPVGEVASAIGMNRDANFTARFRQRFGVAPKVYRLSRS